MNHFLRAGGPVLLCLLLSSKSIAADRSPAQEDLEINDGTIEVVYEKEPDAPYKVTKSNWSGLFGLSVINVKPDRYRSRIDNISYGTMFGDDESAVVQMAQLAIGTKYNTSIAGLTAEVLFGTGQVTGRVNDSTLVVNRERRNLTLTKYGLQFGINFDSLMNEPYVVPYLSGQVFGFDYEETRPNESVKGKTAYTTGYTLGGLFLLDWLDPSSAVAAFNSGGIENTFLDVFVSQLNTSNSSSDPRFETSFNIGAGVKVEF